MVNTSKKRLSIVLESYRQVINYRRILMSIVMYKVGENLIISRYQYCLIYNLKFSLKIENESNY